MTLFQILVFGVYCLLTATLIPPRWRGWVLLGGSVVAIYWLQPATPVRHLDFWLPTAALALTVFVWAITRPTPQPNVLLQEKAPAQSQKRTLGIRPETHNTFTAGLVILGVILALALTRYLDPICCLTPSRPPDLLQIVLVVGIGSVAATLPARLVPRRRILPYLTIGVILGLFIILKSDFLGRATSTWLRLASGQPAELAGRLDLAWLGFSFLAFRWLHVLRDYQAGKLPAYSLGEFVTYAVFFPTYTAGPIDRSQRFIGELRAVAAVPAPPLEKRSIQAPDWAALGAGGERILLGVFKKFVLADGLALIALSAQNAPQVTSSAWMWVVLYAYALRIYFDFSGYTDIALGLGLMVGFHLPENFDHPYLRTNLTTFWNSWHMTLAQWFRAYVFNPFTRYLRQRERKMPVWAIILCSQLLTMTLIGLWHGLTWNFAIWGVWHGAGLFVHNRWSDWIRPHMTDLSVRPVRRRLIEFGGWVLTFNFVALGWVWFALPTPQMALHVFQKLFGVL